MLEAEGLRTWLSERDLPASTAYAEGLVVALENRQAVLLVVSDAALSSDNVYKETDKANDLRLPVFAVASPGYVFPGRLHPPKRWDSVLVLANCRAGAALEVDDPQQAMGRWSQALNEAEIALSATPADAPPSTQMVRARRRAEASSGWGNTRVWPR